jgi:hypothetical protein
MAGRKPLNQRNAATVGGLGHGPDRPAEDSAPSLPGGFLEVYHRINYVLQTKNLARSSLESGQGEILRHSGAGKEHPAPPFLRRTGPRAFCTYVPWKDRTESEGA